MLPAAPRWHAQEHGAGLSRSARGRAMARQPMRCAARSRLSAARVRVPALDFVRTIGMFPRFRALPQHCCTPRRLHPSWSTAAASVAGARCSSQHCRRRDKLRRGVATGHLAAVQDAALAAGLEPLDPSQDMPARYTRHFVFSTLPNASAITASKC